MSSGEQDDASTSESGEDEELHSLLGAFASYHRVQKQSDTVPEGVNVRFGVGGRDERVFASRTSLEFEVNRWDADELGSAPVVHTWDLTPAAADRLNRELLPAALREAATRKGLVVSNRGGYHSTPDFLSRIGDGAESRGADEAEQNERNLSVPVPAARFLSELIRAVALETGKPGVPSGGGRKRKAPAEARDENENEKKRSVPAARDRDFVLGQRLALRGHARSAPPRRRVVVRRVLRLRAGSRRGGRGFKSRAAERE
jgi:hypothetical protein